MCRYSHKTGFTLLEMSIAVLIIALIAGGVVLSRGLVKAAEVRAVISQVQKYQTAVTTFRIKFNQLPGDMKPAAAASLSLPTRLGTRGNGNGDGLIESDYNNGSIFTSYSQTGEIRMFWGDLSRAKLVEGDYLGDDMIVAAAYSTAEVSKVLPVAKIGKGNVISVYGSPNTMKNYFWLIGNVTNVGVTWGYGILGPGSPNAAAISPTEAYSIDLKLDDGLPLSGSIVAINIASGASSTPPGVAVAAAPASGVCVSNATTDSPYNLDRSLGADSRACLINFKFQ